MATRTVQLKREEASGGGARLAFGLIAGCAALLAVAELATSVGISRISRIERRTAGEISALTHRPNPTGARAVLIVGNSLLLDGVNFPALQRGLGQEIQANRLVVEGTYYLDWYYGIRRLFAEGASPDVVVMCLNAAQLTSSSIRGDYSANRLFLARDLLSVANDAGLTPTQASSLWFAHYSAFYGMRAEIRKWILSNLMPSLQELQPYLAPARHPAHLTAELLDLATRRLEASRHLASGHGSRLVLVLPAVEGPGDDTAAIQEAGRQASVPVLVPTAPGEVPAREFSDGFHLNALGARRYTAALIPVLREAVMANSIRAGRNQ